MAGSLEKDTYNENISDIDLRAVTSNHALLDYSPRVAKNLILKQLASLGRISNLKLGTQTVSFRKNGREYQVIPVIRKNGETYLPSEDGRCWRAVEIHAFDRGLIKLNKRTGGRFCEAVRFVKIMSKINIPSRYRLSGHHIETMAYEALRNCPSSMDRTRMVNRILGFIPSRVTHYSPDITGETKAVDRDLGSSYNNHRKHISEHYRDLRDMFRHCRQSKDMAPLDEQGR